MASGRQNQLAKQVGEYLIASELCRRDLIATTFTGNVPHYDIIASNFEGRHLAIQVKTIRRGHWQLDIRNYADVQLNNGKQKIGKSCQSPIRNLIVIFLLLKEYGSDEFYIMKWSDVQSNLVKRYKQYLDDHEGRRPKNANSFHTVIGIKEISSFKDKWDIITNILSHS